MKKFIFIQLLVGISLILSCEKKSEETLCENFKLEQSTLNDEIDYEIINTLLGTHFNNFDYVHIIQKTKATVYDEFIEDKLASENIVFDSTLISDYSEKNSNTYYFSFDNFELNTIQLINPSETNCFFNVEYRGWENYYKKYPKSNGLYTFSRPGINSAGNQAIIEYGWQADYDTGMGYLVVLEKENNKWIVTHRLYTWAS